MDVSKRRLALGIAVYLGALGLFGPLTYLSVVRAIEILVGITGIDTPLSGMLSFAAVVGAIAIAFRVAWEITLVRLLGVAALHRGSPRQRFGRNLLLTVTVLAAGLSIAEFIFGALQWGVTRGQVITTGLSLTVLAGLAWTLARSIRSFRRGLRYTK